MYGQNIQRAEPIILLLLVCVVTLAVLAKRFKTPYPIVLVIAGLVLSLLPRMPHIELNPNVVFLLFLPPLLFSASAQTSWRDFRYNLVSISMLALGSGQFHGLRRGHCLALDSSALHLAARPGPRSRRLHHRRDRRHLHRPPPRLAAKNHGHHRRRKPGQ